VERSHLYILTGDLFSCYNKWLIASESVDEVIGIRSHRNVKGLMTCNVCKSPGKWVTAGAYLSSEVKKMDKRRQDVIY